MSLPYVGSGLFPHISVTSLISGDERYKKPVSVNSDGKTYHSPNCYVAGWGITTDPPFWIMNSVPIDQLAGQLHSVNVDILSRNCLDFVK